MVAFVEELEGDVRSQKAAYSREKNLFHGFEFRQT
jgi:hypothetical protein